MNLRVKELRKALGLSCEKFGKRLGVSRAAISNIENETRGVTDLMFTSIVREFDVNPEWLRYGTGEMFQHSDVFSFDAFIQQNGATDVDIAFLKAYFSLDADIRTKAVSHFMTAFSDKETAAGSSADITDNAT